MRKLVHGSRGRDVMRRNTYISFTRAVMKAIKGGDVMRQIAESKKGCDYKNSLIK